MNNEEMTILLTKHREEIASVKHRLDDLEEQSKVIQDIALSVRELAVNMKIMTDELKKQGRRLDTLEKEPAARMTQIKTAIITALASSLITAAVGAILLLAK